MDSLTPLDVLFCATVLTAAFTVRGGTGFGAATIAVPMLAFVLPIAIAVSVVAVLNALNSVGMVKRDWRKIDWQQLRRLLPSTLAGVGAGLYLMAALDEKSLSHALGGFLIVYSLYAMFARTHKRLPVRWHIPLAATTGATGGFCGALFGGAAGPIYAIYLNVLALEKDAFRVTLTAAILIGLCARITGYAGLGFYGPSALLLVAGAMPMMMLGSWLGDRVVQRLDQQKFARFVGCLLLASGVTYLLK